MWLQQQQVPLSAGSSGWQMPGELCEVFLPCFTWGASPGRGEDAKEFPQRAKPV